MEIPVTSASPVSSPNDFYTTLSLTDVFTGACSAALCKTPPPAYPGIETPSSRISSSVPPLKSVRHHPYTSSSPPPLVSQPQTSADPLLSSLPSSPIDKFKASWHSAIYPTASSASTKSSSLPLLYTPGGLTYVKTEPQVSVPSRLQSAVPSNGSRPRHSSLNSTLSSSSSDASQPLESSSSSSLPSIADSDTRSERVTRLQKLLASHLTIQSSSSSSSSGSSTVHPSPCPTPSRGSLVTAGY